MTARETETGIETDKETDVVRDNHARKRQTGSQMIETLG